MNTEAAFSGVPVSFSDLLTCPSVLEAVKKRGYTEPTPIQSQIIPLIQSGLDVIGQAQTGTGKTAAFALPLLAKIEASSRNTQILVVAPTRELAIQVAKEFESYGQFIPELSVCLLYGGAGYPLQLKQLKMGTQVVVGTPGRIIDHLERGTLDISKLNAFVLDEADEMLRMGFVDEVEKIMEYMPENCQTSLFSATMPPQIRKLANKFLDNPSQVTISTKQKTSIEQKYWPVAGVNKLDALSRILEYVDFESALIFVKTRAATLDLASHLSARGFKAIAINGDMVQNQRERAIADFKSGRINILIATDVASRGLDIESVTHVINYDLPFDVESYVHRIGRTGRAGRTGTAFLFVSPKENKLLRNIEKAQNSKIQKFELPTVKELTNRRIEKFISKLNQTLTSTDWQKYSDVIPSFKALYSEYSEEQIAAALCMLANSEQPLFFKEEPKMLESREDRRDDREDRRGRRRFSDDRDRPFNRRGRFSDRKNRRSR